MKGIWTIALLTMLGTCLFAATAGAGGPRVSVGFSVGVGPRPYHGYYYRRPARCRYYGWRRPIYVVRQRPTVIIRERPVIVEERPVVVERESVVVKPIPAQPSALQQTTYPAPVQSSSSQWTSTKVPVTNELPAISIFLQQLSASEPRVRATAAMELGRRKVFRAVDPLTATLAGDADPSVREAAARALGLIGSRNALTALTNAAQTDSDRDVRRSAQFSAEIILANTLRK